MAWNTVKNAIQASTITQTVNNVNFVLPKWLAARIASSTTYPRQKFNAINARSECSLIKAKKVVSPAQILCKTV